MKSEQELVTLEEMLSFREEKVRLQEEFKHAHKESVIVALGMNIPGPKKTSPHIIKAFQAGGQAICDSLQKQRILVEEEREIIKKQGCLKIFSVKSDDPLFIKKIMIDIEETHPLGRLFDIDVYDQTGNGMSREQLHVTARRCLICGEDAKACGRSRNHTIEELYKRVEDIIILWLEEVR
jgi:holo-ACP synthase